MKTFAGMPVLALGLTIFVLMALAIYVFSITPYVLAGVLLAEIVVLAAAILAPVLSGGAKKGWFGRAVFALVSVALANSYMLFLARHWSIDPQGWYGAVLHWQDGAVRIAGYVVGFLDALLKAIFSLSQGPIAALFARLQPPASIDVGSAFPGGAGRMQSLPLGVALNLVIGVVGSLWTALVLKRVLPRGHDSHGASGGHSARKRH